ncbi:MAG: YdaS family helix-turn-helix protein [Pseudomonadota bacterium]
MDLKTYIQTTRGNASALAEALDIPPSFLSQMASGDRAITPERAARIEVHTARKVMRWDSRPNDWHEIWPELVGTDGAPEIPTPEPTKQEAGA